MLLEIFDAGGFDINCQDGCVTWPIAGTSAHHSQFGQHAYVVCESSLQGIDLPGPIQRFISRAPAEPCCGNPWLTNFDCSVANGSTDVLEHILSHEDCDVDPQNRIGGATPLHLAVQIEHTELRKYIVESLLEAGADFTFVFPPFRACMLNGCRIKDKNGDTALDYIPADEEKLRALFRKQQAQAAVSADDVASGNSAFFLPPHRR